MLIEPREIEAHLLQHPRVKSATVLVCEDERGKEQLTARIEADLPHPGSTGAAIVERWNKIYEITYSAAPSAPSFASWSSSYNRQPIPAEQMQEWLQSALQRILKLNPRNVLEIGCGVGLLLQHLAPRCAAYVGTDFSPAALSRLRCWLTDKDLGHVELLHRSAIELQDMGPGRFDTVVLNSVVQYFPDVDYLLTVLQQAVRLVGPGGHIFIGDVRHFVLLRMFHSAVQLSRAADSVTVEQLRRHIIRAVAQETELALDPEFFQALVGRLPGIVAAGVQLKGGTAPNELTRYRYDVVLSVGGRLPDPIAYEPVTWGIDIGSMTELESALRERCWPAVRINAIPNLRLAAERMTQTLIDTSDERLTAGALRRQVTELQQPEALDPEKLRSLCELHGYDVSIGWSSDESPACFAVQLLDPERSGTKHKAEHRLTDVVKPWDSYTNSPRENGLRQQLIPQLRAWLKERLPEHLLPSDWTVLAFWLVIFWHVFITASAVAGDSGNRASRQWPMVGGDLANTRYSDLDQINKDNVTGLRATWISAKFDEGGTSKVTPIVSDGMMYVTAGRQIYALNAKTGVRVWTHKTLPDQQLEDGNRRVQEYNNTLVSAAGVPSWKGVSVAHGLVFVGLLDGHIIAVNAKTGKLVWSHQTGVEQPRVGQWASTAPTYVNGNIFAGLSDGDHSVRGRFTALDAGTGKQIWQRFAIPGPGEAGHESWPGFNDTWKIGGGGVWTNAAVDPELSLVYFTTGNAVPTYAGDLRPGDNLYTCSVLAFDIRTGALKWYYQLVHHDVFEADLGTPVILYDAQVAGQARKALAVLRSDGYLFQLDRETGKPLLPVEERPVPQRAFQNTSPTQPFPSGAQSVLMSCDEWKQERLPAGFILGCMFTPPASAPPSTDPQNVLVPFPAAKGPLMAYSPQTGYFYAQERSYLTWPRRSQDPYYLNLLDSIPGLREYGHIVAIDSRTGKRAWRKRIPPASLAGGPIVTAGRLMFRGSGDGNVEAYDATTGNVLWHFQTGMAGAGGPPSTYAIDGEQYVAVSMGPAIWAFKLGGRIPAAVVPPSRADAVPFFSGPIVDSAEIETTSLERTLIEPGARYFIDEYTFNPYRTRVTAGSHVLFVNNGNMRHEIRALDGSWGTGPLGPTDQAWVTFAKPGEYTYICKDHPWSYGQIIVSAQDETHRSAGRTTSQVSQGQEYYLRRCSTCHGQSLHGSTTAPALAGIPFQSRWENATVADLFDRIRTTMPQAAPGSLDRETYMSIVAYLLQVNSVGARAQKLDSDPKTLRLMKLRWSH